MQRPDVQALLEEQRAALREVQIYGAKEAMKEAQDAMEFAKETRNANAYTKAIELRSKLMGLLVDKHDIRQLAAFSISIKGVDDLPGIPDPVAEALPAAFVAITEADEDDEAEEETA